MTEPVICPVCGMPLDFGEKTACCANGHSFDRSREGNVNLILNGSPSAGDDPLMAAARRRFLSGGYYSHLLNALKDTLRDFVSEGGTVVDACCGEGYFTNALQDAFPFAGFYGFDLSRRALRYAAKSSKKALFFAANISSVPVKSGAADILLHIFAPVNEKEFLRILSPDGVFVNVFPGRNHLMGIKRVLYDSPRENDEISGISDAFRVISSKKVSATVSLDESALQDLICMTPYFYRTPKNKLEAAMKMSSAVTETEFVIEVLKKLPNDKAGVTK